MKHWLYDTIVFLLTPAWKVMSRWQRRASSDWQEQACANIEDSKEAYRREKQRIASEIYVGVVRETLVAGWLGAVAERVPPMVKGTPRSREQMRALSVYANECAEIFLAEGSER